MSDSSSDQVFNEAPDDIFVREGLPRSYRMRADRHYVDQLDASSAGQPVRMILVSDLPSDEADGGASLRPLMESIRVHGIVHPLIVRRHDNEYRVVAGYKRLLAARTLQHATVPCLVHDLSDAEAAAIAAADNLRIEPVKTTGSDGASIAMVRQILSTHLSGVRGCADLSEGVRGGLQRHALDLLKAHAWRASRLVDALDLVQGGPCVPPRQRALTAILDEVIDGFATENRLAGITIRSDVRQNLSSAGLNDAQIVAGVSGSLLAVLPLVENAPQAVIVIKAWNKNDSEVVIELLQHCAPVSSRIAHEFFAGHSDVDRPGGVGAAMGALAARALAHAHRGDAVFERLEEGGSRLAIVMKRDHRAATIARPTSD